MALVGFLFFWVEMIFKLSHVFLTTRDYHETLFGSWFGWYELCCGCLNMAGDSVFIFVIWSMYYKCFLKSSKFISYRFSVFIAYISVVKCGSVITSGFDCLLFLHKLKALSLLGQFCEVNILLQKRSMPHSPEYYLSTSCL